MTQNTIAKPARSSWLKQMVQAIQRALSFFHIQTEQQRLDQYLSSSTDIYELEARMRRLDEASSTTRLYS